MLIKIDYREKELIEIVQLKMMQTESSTKAKIQIENLKLGDIIIVDDSQQENELILFERKSLNDLASSIKDGRYAEQSFRLDGYQSVPNHNIVYIIEGDLSKWKERTNCRVNKKTLISSMCSMLYYKGFSVIRTMNISETCDLILNWTDKLQRESSSSSLKKSYYCVSKKEETNEASIHNDNDNNDNDNNVNGGTNAAGHAGPPDESHYCDVYKIKKEKNGNITPDNIGEIMLCAIPGISSKTAIVIMKEFKNISGLIKSFENDAHCLNNIYIETNGKRRKISSACIENIRTFLVGGNKGNKDEGESINAI